MRSSTSHPTHDFEGTRRNFEGIRLRITTWKAFACAIRPTLPCASPKTNTHSYNYETGRCSSSLRRSSKPVRNALAQKVRLFTWDGSAARVQRGHMLYGVGALALAPRPPPFSEAHNHLRSSIAHPRTGLEKICLCNPMNKPMA